MKYSRFYSSIEHLPHHWLLILRFHQKPQWQNNISDPLWVPEAIEHWAHPPKSNMFDTIYWGQYPTVVTHRMRHFIPRNIGVPLIFLACDAQISRCFWQAAVSVAENSNVTDRQIGCRHIDILKLNVPRSHRTRQFFVCVRAILFVAGLMGHCWHKCHWHIHCIRCPGHHIASSMNRCVWSSMPLPETSAWCHWHDWVQIAPSRFSDILFNHSFCESLISQPI